MGRLLDSEHDRDEWLGLWADAGSAPFAHPAFGSAFCGQGDRANALVLEQPGGFALLPLLLRPLAPLPGGGDGFDAISPYGYGGPFFAGVCDERLFLEDLASWANANDVCSVFVRLSLDVGAALEQAGMADVAQLNDNVVVDLLRTPQQIWADYEHKVRKNTKKSQRAGCVVTRKSSFEDLDSFVDVYASTMTRRGADERYAFDRQFFSTLGEELAGCYSVFSVEDADGRIVSVELVLESEDFLYSFLGGTRSDAFHMAPNDLLKHEVILYGQQTGRRGFVLGGGYERGDGIFRYKRSFDRAGVQAFRALRVVGNPIRYQELVAARGGDQDASSAFFPAYRAPTA